MSKAEYKRLGDFIREVNVRNRELKVTNLLGVSISKGFMPCIANIFGTGYLSASYLSCSPYVVSNTFKNRVNKQLQIIKRN